MVVIMEKLKMIKRVIKSENKMAKTLMAVHTHTHTHTWSCLLENNGKVNTLQILNKGSTVLNLWRHRAIFRCFV